MTMMRRSKIGILGDKSQQQEPRRLDQGPRTSSQFLQVGYRLQTQDSLKMKLQSMSTKSTDDNLEEISADMFQDRQEVTHLMTFLKRKGKDEKKKRGECKAVFQPNLARQTSSS